MNVSKVKGKKEGRTTENWGTYWQETHRKPRKTHLQHINRENGTSKNTALRFNVNDDEGTGLQYKPRD